MPQEDLYLGRGVVSLEGSDIGLVSELTIFHDMERFGGTAFNTNDRDAGEAFSFERISAIRVQMKVYEYQSAILDKLFRRSTTYVLEADAATYSLGYAGKNRMNDCADVTLNIPLFLPDTPGLLSLITDALSPIEVTGRVMRNALGSPRWYSLSM